MIALIPMAGEGERFIKAGYDVPKPFLPMPDGRRLIDHVLESFPGNVRDVVTISKLEHKKYFELDQVQQGEYWYPVQISGRKTLGPLDTILHARKHINKNDELLINYCDCFLPDNQCAEFVQAMHDKHMLSGVVVFPSDNPRFQKDPIKGQYAMSGIFWFKDARQFLRLAQPYRDDPHMSPGHLAYTVQWLGFNRCGTWITDDYVDLGEPKAYEMYKFLRTVKLVDPALSHK